MKVDALVSFATVLMEWARHEYEGRHRASLPPEAYAGSPEMRDYIALQLLVRVRQNVIPAIVAAGVGDCYRVMIEPEDMPRLVVMGQDPVENWSRNKLAEESASAYYVRALAGNQEPLNGPMIAIMRRHQELLTFFDGMHRLAAWVAHIQRGFTYPLSEVYLIETERPAPAFELPERKETER